MYRVIKRFNDRYTGERYDVGQRYETDEPGRADHLLTQGFLREEREAPRRGPMGRFLSGGGDAAGGYQPQPPDGDGSPPEAE